MQPTTMLPKLTDTTQTISFSEGDGMCSAEVFATGVVVTTNAGNHDHGSSKVKLKNLVDYNWEPKFYSGQLLAIHMSEKYLAYCIKAPNAVNPGTWNGMVRVVYNPESGSDRRALIKGMKGEVQDLSFAHIQNQIILACIDEQGNFYVHEIEVTDSGLRCTLLAEIRDETVVPGSGHRVVWCPYIPDDDDEAPDEDVAKLLLTTHGNIGRIWNMRVITGLVSSSECVGWAGALAAAGGGGVRATAEHSARLVAAAFSPDGTALATAAADGYVMFFQVYMQNDSSPRCLHKWQPHGGKPLSSLFFLDNHTNYNSEVQFWKFAVTGAENNTTIKVWSCKSWNCMQTIRFTPSLGSETLGLKAMLDRSASYLLLSDFKSRSLYVLNMARDSDDTVAYCKSISEFLLPYPVLSFCIIGAEEQQVKCESSCDDPFNRNGSSGDTAESPDDFMKIQDDEEDGEESGSALSRRVCVRLYIVQPKGLQEGRLVYAPADQHAQLLHGISDLALEDKSPEESSTLASSILQQQSQQLKNLLLRAQPQPSSLIVPRPESPPSAPQLNLMTPDAFSSPGKREDEDTPNMTSPEVTKPRNSTSGPLEESPGVPCKLTSGGSSPSREVQQIMSHNTDDEFYKDDLEEACEAVPDVEPPSVACSNGPEPGYPQDMFDAAEDTVEDVFAEAGVDLHTLPHTGGDTSWPQISIAQITSANQRAASSDKLAHPPPAPLPPLPAVLLPPPPANAAPAAPTAPAVHEPLFLPLDARVELSREDKDKLDSLEQKLDKLTELVSIQSAELRTLRESACASPRAAVEEALDAHAQRTTQAVETALTLGWERIARVGEAASARAAQAAGAGAARALEPLAAALQHELAVKLTATDHLLRDNIEKLANSKSVTERLSSSIAKSVSEVVRDSFRAALFETVLPAMEKAHTQIFRQINNTFQNGTKEFCANTEAAARAAAERGGAAATASLRAALDRHAEALAATAQAPPVPHAHQLTAVLKEAAHSVLEKEMTWWREQARTVAVQMSRAHSPSTPSVADRQMQVAQIQSLMNGGDVNGAFQLALSASDLALVMCACRSADPAVVFGPPCQLRQHVLLSLVQQLAADMTRDTHLKHRFLEEAVMNLDTSNPVTREHLPAVVRELQSQIMSFLKSSPSHALARHFRMLLMATEALLKGTA